MKVFLDGAEDSFLFHKVEETASGDAILPLTLSAKVGSLRWEHIRKLMTTSELARRQDEHQDEMECDLCVENLGKEM